MTQAIKYESLSTTAWVQNLDTVKHELTRWVQAAYLGEIGTGSFTVNDPDGTAGHDSDGIVGLKTMRVTQSACPAGKQYIYTGFVGLRKYRRGADLGNLGIECEIDVTVQDVNAAAGFDAFNASEGNRPAESVGARLTWLLASGKLDALDTGFVTYPSAPIMNATNYQNRTPADVLADCAMAVGYNWFLRWDAGVALSLCLCFYAANTSTIDSSTLKISNAGDDDGTTIFAPLTDVELNRDPSRVASDFAYEYASGTVYVHSAATQNTFARRKHVASNSDVKTAGNALLQAGRLLRENSTEEDQLSPVTILVPAAHVNDALAGQRIQVKFTHLRGYTTDTWCRILRRTVSQPQTGTDVGGANEDLYLITMDLSPQEQPCSSPTDLNLAATVTVDTGRGSGRQWQRPADSNDGNVVTFAQIDNGFGDFVSYLKSDLGADYLVSAFQIINRGDTDAMPSGVHDGDIYYSDDGGVTLHAIPYTFSGAYAAYLTGGATLTFDTPVLARLFYIKASNGGAGAFINRCDIETWAIPGCS